MEKRMNEIMQKLAEPLTKEDIDLRVGNISEKGFTLLLYKTARTDVKRLNSVCGIYWKNRHFYDTKGLIVCEISIYDAETGQWISREDVGTESNTEKEKGSYSDSFKRAGFKWGIGIELYNPPFIFIKWKTEEYTIEVKDYKNQIVKKKKYKLDNFYDDNLEITNYEIKEGKMFLTISYNGAIVFTNIKGRKATQPQAQAQEEPKKEPVSYASLYDEKLAKLKNIRNIGELSKARPKIEDYITNLKRESIELGLAFQKEFDKVKLDINGATDEELEDDIINLTNGE
jgi:hypothetical protein